MPAKGEQKWDSSRSIGYLITKFLKMKRLIFLLLMQLTVFIAFGQIKLSGIITGNGKPLTGASVILENSYYGVSTSGDGIFEFKNLKNGDYKVKVSFIGFENKVTDVELNSDKTITINLEPNVVMTIWDKTFRIYYSSLHRLLQLLMPVPELDTQVSEFVELT